MSNQSNLFPETPFAFGPRFLIDHAGHIITDPRIALVELVANSYDAGASSVEIQWPEKKGGFFQILDNGTGMTIEEFNSRWRTLSYSRSHVQGMYVEYPPEVKAPKKRVAFGQNGKGRFGPFCFSDAYQVETWKTGLKTVIQVSSPRRGDEPFHCELVSQRKERGHGTLIRAAVHRNLISKADISEAVGSKFLVDPYFSVTVNGRKLDLLSLSGIESYPLIIEPHGEIKIHQIDALVQDRTTLLRGITWWVNGRMVGSPSWDGLDGRGAILDGRTSLAKRCSFVVEADFLKKDVKSDWTGFHDNSRTIAAREATRKFVCAALDKLLAESRRERKREALAESKEMLAHLPSLSKRLVGQFIDEIQQKCPTLGPGDLARTVTVFTKMEAARSGYDLLEKLSACSVDDLDTWNRLMEEWNASNAEIILSELKRRLDLIERLQQLVNVSTTDELHELHPLFARGLWMFGPEYESVEFTSNIGMAKVIRSLLNGASESIDKYRPDIVALADSSLCCYTADHFDAQGEIVGIRKVMIIELKRGGFDLGTAELRQGEDYALELRKANLVTESTEIIVYVLGANVSDDAIEERTIGKVIRLIPMRYDTLLKRAHSRTFNLQKKLKKIEATLPRDEDVESVVVVPLFDSIAEQ